MLGCDELDDLVALVLAELVRRGRQRAPAAILTALGPVLEPALDCADVELDDLAARAEARPGCSRFGDQFEDHPSLSGFVSLSSSPNNASNSF